VSHAWERWAAATVRNRWPAAALALVLLGLLVIPALSIRIGDPRAEALATSGSPKAGLEALERGGIGTGVLTPFDVLVTGTDPAAVAQELAAVDGVQTALAPEGESWRAGETALVVVLPEEEASSTNGRRLTERLRSAADSAEESLGGTVQIGGQPAGSADGFKAIYDNFPLMLLAITVVTYLLLVRAFRSLLLPLKAVILNALSIGAAYGVLVLVWQKGWGSELIWGIEASGSITDWVPLMAFSFLFGLSMDYEVFILTRMREEYDATGSTDAAVVRGIGRTARLVTTAAIILFLAFVSMAAVPDTSVKIMATGLAAGILLDATIVRALLVPATVSLMGKWNWWLPSWLEWFAAKDEVPERRGAAVTVGD
jgi:RND superfamily putative drug exporter